MQRYTLFSIPPNVFERKMQETLKKNYQIEKNQGKSGCFEGNKDKEMAILTG